MRDLPNLGSIKNYSTVLPLICLERGSVCGRIYDGTFSNRLIGGDGVTTILLKKNKIKVITEEDL